ncbi:hypothetical protein [Microbacterium sp. 179-I 3D3 NHS]|uniref:hypothetical protein n=1 Tax=unclassified Microbacterium TaxID=2609290 RepID=UPI0039A2EC44
MTSRQLRLMRAAAVSSVATLIAAVSHTLGGGAAPHPLLVVAVAILLLPACAVLVGPRRSRPRVAAAVVVGQAAFHLVFQALGSPTGSAALGAGSPAGAAHAHHLDLTALPAAALGAAAAAPGPAMIGAHVVAAALTTLLLWHGETIVRAVAGWFLARLHAAVACSPAEHGRPVPLRSLVIATRDAAVSAAVSRRGPPLLLRG